MLWRRPQRSSTTSVFVGWMPLIRFDFCQLEDDIDRVPENPKTRPENWLPDPTRDCFCKTRPDPKPEI